MFRLTKKGQSTAEYAIVIGLVIAAIVAMQVYVKRGIQGKVKDAVDYKDSSDTVTGTTTQYEPYYTQSSMSSTQSVADKEDVATGGGVTRTSDTTASRTGTQKITSAVNQ
ncbi:MAG: hypothetical protein WC315_09475 [Candidatus Omnitrophota bacterium]|jgi:hypothetical protein